MSTKIVSYSIGYNTSHPNWGHLTTSIMLAIERAMVYSFNGSDINITANLKRFPESEDQYSQQELIDTGLIWLYCPAMFNMILFTQQLMSEKEKRVRVVMRTMGLADIWFWISWIITFVIISIMNTLVIIISGHIFSFPFIAQTNFFVAFCVFLFFALSLIPFACVLSVVASRASTANTLAFMLFVIGFIIQLILSQLSIYYWFSPNTDPLYANIFQLYPPFTFYKCWSDISTITSNWKNSNYYSNFYSWKFVTEPILTTLETSSGIVDVKSPPLLYSLHYMFGTFLILVICLMYLDQVVPSSKGKSRPWYFPLNPFYYKRLIAMYTGCDRDNRYDVLTSDFTILQVENLVKEYKNILSCCSRSVLAVDNLSFSVNEGELFCILGHNGAGKTTTMSILTGLLDADSGKCRIYGYDVETEMEKIREFIGICPQFDIVWDNLTAYEHLKFFAMVKQIDASEINNNINKILREVDLERVSNKLVNSFSGGMKRRLSVAISVIGDPRILFLDEPTTGMDPKSRKEVWLTIQRLKRNKVIILTTHSMNEADELSDIIGIMDSGSMKCFGSPIQLKKEYGNSYKISINYMGPVNSILEAIENSFPEYYTKKSVPGRLEITVPIHFDDVAVFFQEIPIGVSNQILHWGISYTTMEDVFLTVTDFGNINDYRIKP
eukprot:TRINITY_DN1973_c0_g1_i2.p1 TRINITY_DN1973_c0_g1~~TRINITY_DN1973_c0_g1_i2.p1  ORF type:complete len:667 (-),score=106.50 TRINITY_DN1973_c0_g1_i2:547-2547(-)